MIRIGIVALSVFSLGTNLRAQDAGAGNDPDLPFASISFDPDQGGQGELVSQSIQRGIPGSNDDCEASGGVSVAFQFENRYRGNLVRITETGYSIREIKMALAFTGATDLYVSIHHKEANGTYSHVDINNDPGLDFVLIAGATGNGDFQFYSSGSLADPGGVSLPPGDYAIGFAWGNHTVKFGRDTGVGYPQAFSIGSLLGSVSRDVMIGEPPLPGGIPELNLFAGAVYAMEFCFDPMPQEPCVCPPPDDCFRLVSCDPATGGCAYSQLPEHTSCSFSPIDPACSYYACDANGDCLRQCDENCFSFGDYTVTFSLPSRYRGNLYQVNHPVILKEIGMELAFAGNADLYVSVHRKQADNSYAEVDINADPAIGYAYIAGAKGVGINSPRFYSTGALGSPGPLLPPGNYAIGFAWGDSTVKYGRDTNVPYPRSFSYGSILSSVSRDISNGEPPLPFNLPALTEFSGGAYKMELCLQLCGNGLIDGQEECDGLSVGSCASGRCNADCTCESGSIPTLSEWGLAVLALLCLVAAKIIFNRKMFTSSSLIF